MSVFHIGRDYEEPIKINEKSLSVSHNHATITIENGVWTLQDLDSTNGTFVEDDGMFRRCSQLKIKPSTWIRLGEQGHRGHYFKARRVLKPNDYREDFEELYQTYQDLESAKSELESNRRKAKFIMPVLMIVGLGLSFLPVISENGLLVRASFMLPGFISPFIQDILMNRLEQKVKRFQKELICPKCRRVLGKDDIINREHSYCKAH